MGLEVPSDHECTLVRDADQPQKTYLDVQLKLYAGRPHAAYLRKTAARRATSGSCLRSSSTGSALNHKITIGLATGQFGTYWMDGEYIYSQIAVMTTVNGIGEQRKDGSSVNRTNPFSESIDRPCEEYLMSTLGEGGYREWKQNPVQWHIP